MKFLDVKIRKLATIILKLLTMTTPAYTLMASVKLVKMELLLTMTKIMTRYVIMMKFLDVTIH